MHEIDTMLDQRKGGRRLLHAFLPEAIAFGVLFSLAAFTAHMIYHDSYVEGSKYSNRSFAIPAAGFSALLVGYLAYRLKWLPLWSRIVSAPFVFFVGYLAIGLGLIVLNQMF
ncbi:MAG: hypothetical protein ACSHX9_10135 [Luteolibacter sp.]